MVALKQQGCEHHQRVEQLPVGWLHFHSVTVAGKGGNLQYEQQPITYVPKLEIL